MCLIMSCSMAFCMDEEEKLQPIKVYCLTEKTRLNKILPYRYIKKIHISPETYLNPKQSSFALYADGPNISRALAQGDGSNAMKLVFDNIGRKDIRPLTTLPGNPIIVLHDSNDESKNIAYAFIAAIQQQYRSSRNIRKIIAFEKNTNGSPLDDETFMDLLQPTNDCTDLNQTQTTDQDLSRFYEILDQNKSILNSVFEKLTTLASAYYLDKQIAATVGVISLVVIFLSYKAIKVIC
jgi:predicted RNA binding protein with dsRBD fold (UPF0201 family)